MSERLLNLQPQQRKTFAKHFLNAVHCELGFAGTAIETILAKKSQLKEFMSTRGFHDARTAVQGHIQMNQQDSDKNVTVTHKANPIGLVFTSQKPRRILQVVDSKLIYSDDSYTGFDSFLLDLKDLFTEITKIVPRGPVTKIGLRKINSIHIEPANSVQDACVIFNPVLFATVRSGLVQLESLKVHEEVTVLERGSHMCIMRAKLQKLPSPNACEASLDFDFISNSSTELPQVFDEVLPTLNRDHFDLFIWAASDSLIEMMEGK